MDDSPVCPDCGVVLESMQLEDGRGAVPMLVADEPQDNLFGSLGGKQRLTPVPYVCPECCLIRWYAAE